MTPASCSYRHPRCTWTGLDGHRDPHLRSACCALHCLAGGLDVLQPLNLTNPFWLGPQQAAIASMGPLGPHRHAHLSCIPQTHRGSSPTPCSHSYHSHYSHQAGTADPKAWGAHMAPPHIHMGHNAT